MSEKDYDPRMHTVEHLLNGAIAALLQCPRAFSTHIERKKSKIDFRCHRNLTPEEISSIEDGVNTLIKENVAVETFFLPIDQARCRYDLSRLPEEASGDIRIVKIGSTDSCPCIGQHLSNTAMVAGNLKIISTDFSSETSVLRVRFKIV